MKDRTTSGPEDSAVGAWVDAHADELLRLTADLVKIPSEAKPPEGHEAAAQAFLRAVLERAGAQLDVFSPDEVPGLREHPAYFPTWDGMPRPLSNRPVVVGTFHGAGGGRSLLFSGHVDTVPREPLPWDVSTPFSGEIKDGKLYGRGAVDTKAAVPVALFAVQCARALNPGLRGTIVIESVSDEEYGGSHGVLAARLRGHNADVAINFEPTGLAVCPEHRGGGEWRITCTGNEGLAFFGERLINPVYNMARVIEALRAYEEDRNARVHVPPLFAAEPELPVYPMQLRGGGSAYWEATGIPHETRLYVWIETFKEISQEEHDRDFVGFMTARLREDPRYSGPLPEFTHTIRYLPGSAIGGDHPILGALRDAFRAAPGRDYVERGASMACDTYMFNLHSPTPAVTMGPGGGGQHGRDEFVHTQDLIDLTKIYAQLILDWCA